MSAAVKTLLWKEFRENFRVWGAAVVDGLILLAAAVLARDALSIRAEDIFSIGALIVSVYAMILSADIFVREKEDSYLPLLNRFPITARQVASAKILWIALSTLALADLFGIVCRGLLLSGLFPAAGPVPTLLSFCSWGVILLSGILWGIYWSTRTERRLSAIILTMLCTAALPILAELFSQSATDALVTPLFLLVECVVCELLISPALNGTTDWFNGSGRTRSFGRSPLLDKFRPTSPLPVLTAQGIARMGGAAALLQLSALLPLPLLIASLALPPSEAKQSIELLTLLVVAGNLLFGIFMAGSFLVWDFREGEHTFLLRLPPRPFLFWFGRLAGICLVWILPAAIGFAAALTAGYMFGSETGLLNDILRRDEVFPAFRAWGIANAVVFAAAVPILGLWTGALCRNRVISISLEIFLLEVLLSAAFLTTPPTTSPLVHFIPLSLFAAGSYDLVRRQLRGAVSTLYRVAHLLLLPAAALTIILVIFPLVRVYSVALLPEDFDPDQIARYGWADRLRGERDYFHRLPLRRACKAEALAALRASRAGNLTADTIPIEGFLQRRVEFFGFGLDVLTPGWDHYWTSEAFDQPLTDTLWREEALYDAIHRSAEMASPEQLRRFIEVLGAIPQNRPTGARLDEAFDRLYRAQLITSFLNSHPDGEQSRGFFIPRIDDPRPRWEKGALCRRFLHNKHILDLYAARQAEQSVCAAGPVRSSGAAAAIVSVPEARKLYRRQPSDEHPGVSWYSEESLLCLRRIEGLLRRGMYLRDDQATFFSDLWAKRQRRCSPEEEMLLHTRWAAVCSPKPYQIEVKRLMAMVESALLLYRHEHDRQWPETIDDLVAAGCLPEVPVLPGGGFDRPVRFELSPRAEEPIRYVVKTTSKGQIARRLADGASDPKSQTAYWELPEDQTSLLPDRFLAAETNPADQADPAAGRTLVRFRSLWGPPRGQTQPADSGWGWCADTGVKRRLVWDRPFPFVREAARVGIDPVTAKPVPIQPACALFGSFPIEIEDEPARSEEAPKPEKEAPEPEEK